jgi:hypothetical protein
VPVVTSTIRATTRAGYYPGAGHIWMKLVVHAGGVAVAAKRTDVLATALWGDMLVADLEPVDLGYAPPFQSCMTRC